MSLLLILTLIYIAILVLALAASLIAILVYLLQISKHLGEVRALLTTVEEKTRPLHGPLELLQTVASDTGQNLNQAKDKLSQADQHLVAFAGQLR